MDVDPRAAGGHPAADDRWLTSALGAAVVGGAVLTLLPEGHGWAWGSPLAELRWYATGLTDEPTLLQLTGNLGLLAAPRAPRAPGGSRRPPPRSRCCAARHSAGRPDSPPSGWQPAR